MERHYHTDLDLTKLPAAVAEAVRKYIERWHANEVAKNEAHVEIAKVLNAVQTTKKLYEIWPELAEVVPKVEEAAEGKWMLPDMSRLNSVLGIGEKKK
jgi:hypothetical protein